MQTILEQKRWWVFCFTERKSKSDDTQEMPQSRSTSAAFPKRQKKERWGKNNDKTKASNENTNAKKEKCNRKTALDWLVGRKTTEEGV